MTGPRITIEGVDADRKAASEITSRILAFPDGQARHIALAKRYWEVFDKLQSVRGWSEAEITGMAYQGAIAIFTLADPAFEERLRWGLRHCLRIHMGYVMKDEGDWNTANDDDFVVHPERLTPLFNAMASGLSP
jgi:hypothetical protein